MSDNTEQLDDDQNLWRSVYTAEGGWSTGVVFADHLSAGAPALAEVNGTLYCVHRGAREEGEALLPVRWASFTPAAAAPYVAALEKASEPPAEGASQEAVAAWEVKVQAAGAALDRARRWTPDAEVEGAHSKETPAVVDDNGTLRMVFSFGVGILSGGVDVAPQKLYETELDTTGDTPVWTDAREVSSDPFSVAPALAVFKGQVHLLHLDLLNAQVRHLVRGDNGAWQPFVRGDGTAPDPLAIDAYLHEEWNKGEGVRATMSAAIHDGRLHLLHCTHADPEKLRHSSFDGTAWTEHDTIQVKAQRTAALASFAGALHAVFPTGKDTLKHRTWTEAKGWQDGADLKGHDSTNTPALLAFRDGPPHAAREALLLVHRGVDRYVPPPPPPVPTPPAPPKTAKVATRGETVRGKIVADYGWRAWSRALHRVSLTPATLEDGKKALIATWEAEPEYYWLGSYYPENRGNPYRVSFSGVLWLKKQGEINFLRHADFSGTVDSTGRFRFDTVFADLKAGTYELSVSSNTKKTGGYWYGNQGLEMNDPDKERCTRLTVSKAYATHTL
ncbi:hypothetical protein ACFCW4_31140 [Streptomyces virginiae]|uniref:hypothetical protein n=1 Tax=Streptomyces virginiae TaxID=1961 RepID=UPI0035DE1D4A